MHRLCRGARSPTSQLAEGIWSQQPWAYEEMELERGCQASWRAPRRAPGSPCLGRAPTAPPTSLWSGQSLWWLGG